ncbi:hypothetical protein NDU88_008234 [Pleurodeles waltl]|uniref:Uncharacterized protein n=1 Tax=Pleurodeles waltl TaxID=8319 RepID=A0AAV7NVD5_PLEWA|nr:hypothetical protein NDU88_008234 [Pleurodeles waltl]
MAVRQSVCPVVTPSAIAPLPHHCYHMQAVIKGQPGAVSAPNALGPYTFDGVDPRHRGAPSPLRTWSPGRPQEQQPTSVAGTISAVPHAFWGLAALSSGATLCGCPAVRNMWAPGEGQQVV